MKAPWISPINSANTERPQSPVIAIMFQFQEHSFVYKQEIKFNTHTKDRKANRNNTCCYHTAAKSCKWKLNASENNDIQAFYLLGKVTFVTSGIEQNMRGALNEESELAYVIIGVAFRERGMQKLIM